MGGKTLSQIYWEEANVQTRLFVGRTMKILLATLLLAVAAQQGRAQNIFGRLSGTVTDASGGVVPKAKITIANEATHLTRTTATGDNGYYVVEDLPVGTYSLTVEAENFKKYTRTGIDVTAGGRATMDIGLEVGVITQSVIVKQVGETVNTTSAEISTRVDESQVKNLALNQRHYEQLITLIPGAALSTAGLNPAAQVTNYNTSIANLNGQRLDGLNLSVDGGFNLDSGSFNSVISQVGLDFVREVDVQASNYDAEFGRAASGTVNAITKSGTDQFHGGGFEFVQNNVFNAANSGLKLNAKPGTGGAVLDPAFRFNDFGWDLGGPVWKKHLFFFGGMEWRKIGGVLPGLSTTTNQTLPTAKEVTGDFTDAFGAVPVLAFHAPQSGLLPPGCTVGTFFTAPNVINPVCLTTDGKAIAAVFAKAALISTAGGLPTSVTGGNATFALPTPVDNREDIIRIDYQANAAHSFYFRYIHDKVDVTSPTGTFGSAANLPVDPDARHRPGHNYQLGWVDIITPHLISEAKINSDWNKQRIPPVSTSAGSTFQRADYTPSLLFTPPLGFVGDFPHGIPQVTFNGNAAFPTTQPAGWPGPGPNFLLSPTVDINPSENVTWLVRNHSVKFGLEYFRNRKNQNSRATPSFNGSLNFSTSAGNCGAACTGKLNSTGDAFADALIGNYNTFSQTSSDPIGQFRFNGWEAYIQDSWKVARKLSLDLGVRWVLTGPTYAQGNNMTNFDPYQYNPALASTVANNGGLSGNGLCSGNVLTLPGNPPIQVECNGLARPGNVPFDQQGRVSVTYTDPNLLAAIPPTAARGLYQPQSLFAPRVGIALSPFGNDKTVLRAGFGMFFDKPQANVLGQGVKLQGLPPWTLSFTSTAVGGLTPSGNLTTFDTPTPPATPPSPTSLAGMGTVDPRLKVGGSMQYSLSVQRELPRGMLAQAAYVGNQGRHILRGPGINEPINTFQGGFIPAGTPNVNITTGSTDQLRPFLGYQGIGGELSDSTSNYNSLQLSLTKRAGWLTTSLSYTYSKTMGEDIGGTSLTSGGYNTSPSPDCLFYCLVSTAYQTLAGPPAVYAGGSNPVLVNGGFVAVAGGTQTGGVREFWKQYDYGKVSFDATHIFAASYTIESPFGKNWNGVRGALVKGWSLSGITHYQSGAPLTVTSANTALGFSSDKPVRRASIIPGTSLAYSAFGAPCPANKVCWFNPGAFAHPSPLGAGDAPIGDIIGPAFQQWDVSLRKTFGLHWREGMTLLLQADAFNVLNHSNWGNPNTGVGTATSNFGKITTSNPARALQFGGKVTF